MLIFSFLAVALVVLVCDSALFSSRSRPCRPRGGRDGRSAKYPKYRKHQSPSPHERHPRWGGSSWLYLSPISLKVTTSGRSANEGGHVRLQLATGSGFGGGNKDKRRPTRSNSSSGNELFELQELRAQLQTMLKQDILYQNLSVEKREELTGYVRAVVEKSQSPIDFKGGGMGTAQFVAGVESKSWRMLFSTDPSTGDEESPGAGGPSRASLPFGSQVLLRINSFIGCEGKLDYVLKFSKQVMGLNELVAKSTCSVDIGPVNPGLFTFQYNDIKTNVFGMSNIPVGFFGLLKDRLNYIDTVWFDGIHWFERTYLDDGTVVFSVYVRDTEDEKNR
mmetsp:Transcript_19567/g.45923  ORF Transcript_19567/g.45923 Transcript_19567/m.45923 type:complete len:334 (-) Transcript_19567:845-1846(-)